MLKELKLIVGANEKIFYEGKPNKKCYIFESIFNPLLPFALIWAIIDLGVLGGVIFMQDIENVLYFLIHYR